ncbi:RNA 2'-phosphotransferase [Curtobacterium sp. KT1]|uniref:RNA 2'-phosphotransferase n=1 Tax=Curtobacterium sp. KT1 TaxID=3372858 RepID=UPI0037BE6465
MAKGNLMARRDVEISKAMSHALRHEPKAYALNLSDDGSVPLTDLAGALEATGLEVDSEDLRRVVAQSDKQRFALVGDRIRAQCGYSAGAHRHVVDHASAGVVACNLSGSGCCDLARRPSADGATVCAPDN